MTQEDCADTQQQRQQPVMAGQGQPPRPYLPVARCGDCLYAGLFGTLPQYQCRRESPIVGGGGWYVVFDADWCGEFVHKTLGAQLSDGAYGKRWRFPTEPE